MGRDRNSLLQRFEKDPREVVAKKKHGGEVGLARREVFRQEKVRAEAWGIERPNTVHGGWLTEKRAGGARWGGDKEEHGRQARGGSG